MNGFLPASRIISEKGNDYLIRYGGIFVRKTFIIAVTLIAALGTGATSAFALGAGQARSMVEPVRAEASGAVDISGIVTVSDNVGSACQHTDTDNDGICDNCGKNCQYVDVTGSVNYDNTGNYCRHTDADNDGICDYCGTECAGGYHGGCADDDGNTGYGHHSSHGARHESGHHGGCSR